MDRWSKTGRAGGVRDNDRQEEGRDNGWRAGNGGHEISRGTGGQGGQDGESNSYVSVLIKYEAGDGPCFSFNLGSKSVLFL